MSAQATQVENRHRVLDIQIQSERHRPDALSAMADCEHPQLHSFINEVLNGTVSGDTSAALDVIESRPDEDWTKELNHLISRVDPADGIPSPSVWYRCFEYLLRRGLKQKKASRLFQKADLHALAESALLALEFDPPSAKPLFLKALRSSIPICRMEAASMLAIIDLPWSRELLVESIQASSDHQMTTHARAALLESLDPEAKAVSQNWSNKNPRESETDEFITFEEMMIRNAASEITWQMSKWHDRVYPLRYALNR